MTGPTTGRRIGGEPTSKVDLEALCRTVGFERVRVIDPNDLEECDRVLKEELLAAAPSIIIARRPCAILKGVETKPPLSVSIENCTGCKACMKIACPAISVREKKAVVDRTLCVGCDVCVQLCKFDALYREKE